MKTTPFCKRILATVQHRRQLEGRRLWATLVVSFIGDS